MMDVVLLGPPGAGKGTQAVGLAQRFQLKHISTGDLLRSAVKSGTELGREAEDYMKKGELVPDTLILNLIQEALPTGHGVLFDGFPRNVAQAKALDEVLKGKDRKLSCVVNLELSDAEVLKRLSGRRQCASCGEIFHVDHHAPKKAGICDVCGGEVVQRADDQEATILNRIAVYHNQTQPLIHFYREAKLLETVDASGRPEVVGESVIQQVERRRS